MQHLDEGTIHAWLDGADVLDANERAGIEAHVASCEQCAAAVAEARGLIAGTSRLLGSLDHVPAGVIPRESAAPSSSIGSVAGVGVRGQRRGFRVTPAWAAAAAAVVIAAVGIVGSQRGGSKGSRVNELPTADTAAVLQRGEERVALPTTAPVAVPTAPAVGGVGAQSSGGTGTSGGGVTGEIRKTRQATPTSARRSDLANSLRDESTAVRGNVAARDLAVERKRAFAAAEGRALGDSIATDSVRAEARLERLAQRPMGAAALAPTLAPSPAPPSTVSKAADGRVPVLEGCYEVAPTMAADAAAPAEAPPPASPRQRTSAVSGAVARPPAAYVMTSAFVLDSVLDQNTGVRTRSVWAPMQPGRPRTLIGRWELVSANTARVTFADGRPALLLTTTPEGAVLARPADDSTRAGTVLRRCS